MGKAASAMAWLFTLTAFTLAFDLVLATIAIVMHFRVLTRVSVSLLMGVVMGSITVVVVPNQVVKGDVQAWTKLEATEPHEHGRNGQPVSRPTLHAATLVQCGSAYNEEAAHTEGTNQGGSRRETLGKTTSSCPPYDHGWPADSKIAQLPSSGPPSRPRAA